ncbi:hypothetical protein ADU59_00255 (plasmid) [Pararhizobium polonicum]|uniref:Uncharacterized protein n=1 Tax=Pararhizobium polonicum TaxID=1612624 RepID=A0A1C7P8A2_9HYPH|nr:hypothetical protein [Pararhizobium polonicum]OBZ97493.1 hypothetical protein ADU59_00255 [Pararhizobium polonicum]
MSTIEEAQISTTTIQDQVGIALEALQRGFEGRIINGYGVYADPSSRHRDLLEARKAIEVALSAMTSTRWPTEAQYEKAEQA